jgi:hypothetical protein
MGAVDAEARKLSKVIDHPIRSRIITLLGERGALGWKELSTELGVRTGALYHHLDTLEGLVERDPSKKYALTKAGRIVYAKTSQSHTIDAVKEAAMEIRQEGTARRLALAIFVPRSMIRVFTSSKSVAAIVSLAFAGALALLSGIIGISPIIYYLRPNPSLLSTLGGFSVSLAGLVALGYASAKIIFNSSVDILPLAASASLSYLPVFAFSILTRASTSATLFASSSTALTLCLVFFQAWSSSIFGAGLSVASGIRIERTLLVSLAVLYATMVVMLLLGTRL